MNLRVKALLSGYFALDVGAMFGVVPRVLWEKIFPPDEKNRITLALRSFLIQSKGRNILIDTGVGELLSEKQKDIFKVNAFGWESVLKKVGLAPQDITDVIISHLHFDHVGGSILEGGVPVFKNATYWVQKRNMEHAHAPTPKDQASFWKHVILPLKSLEKVRLIDGEYELIPGVQVRVTEGHTPAQSIVAIETGERSYLFGADTIPTHAHIRLPYIMAYDLFPLKTLEEKKKILEEVVRKGSVLLFCHDPQMAACFVKKEGGKYKAAGEVLL